MIGTLMESSEAILEGALRPIFLDTSYVYALVNSRDEWHSAAKAWQASLTKSRRRLITTEIVLVEIGDGLASVKFRGQALEIIKALQSSPLVEIVVLTSDNFAKAMDLYENRHDKDWGLTDCVSFVTMSEYQITESLTVDKHFQEAGFRALLRENPI